MRFFSLKKARNLVIFSAFSAKTVCLVLARGNLNEENKHLLTTPMFFGLSMAVMLRKIAKIASF